MQFGSSGLHGGLGFEADVGVEVGGIGVLVAVGAGVFVAAGAGVFVAADVAITVGVTGTGVFVAG